MILAAGLSMIVLDGTIVGVSIPSIIDALHLDLTQAQWINSLYSVILAALLLTSGRLGDRVGRRRLFVIGVVLFMAGSLVAAMASGADMLIWGRVIQGIGGAAVLPSTLSTVNATFTGKDRAAAFGVWGAVMSGAAALGPLLGGVFTTYLDWRWIFLVNIPLGLLVLLGAWAFVPETTEPHAEQGIDVPGVLLSASGLGLLVFTLIEGPSLGWWAPKGALELGFASWGPGAAVSAIPITAVLSILLLAAFLGWEKHRAAAGRSAILDLGLFEHRTFSWGNATATLVAMGEFGLLLVLPLYLINVLGTGTMGAGLILAAMALGAFLSGASARHLSARIGSDRVVILGLGMEVIGVLAIVFIARPGVPVFWLGLVLVLYGLGLGLASAQLTSTVLRDIPAAASGQGSATQSTVRQLGAGFGTAVSGSVLAIATTVAATQALTALNLPGLDATQWAARLSDSAGGIIPSIKNGQAGAAFGDAAPEVARAMSEAFTTGVQAASFAAAVCLLAGLAGSLMLSRAARAMPADPTDTALATKTGRS